MATPRRPDRQMPARTSPSVALPRRWWIWALVLLAMGTAAGLHVRSRLAVVQMGYALSEASGENRKLRAQHRKLVLEAATLRSPRRLRKLAVEKLGLVEPGPEQILKIVPRQPSKLALGQ